MRVLLLLGAACHPAVALHRPLVAGARARQPVAAAAGAPPAVLCVGECLFDGLPAGVFLGGAPLNVAVHLSALGVRTSFASAVGDDRLGVEAVRRLESRGVDTSLVSTVAAETGFVTVELDDAGDASYEFATPAAWDLVPSDGVADAAGVADAVVYGTLASRAAATREAIREARMSARLAVCDINLRPPFDDAELVAEAARGADLLKLADEEVAAVAAALQAAADDIVRRFADADAVADAEAAAAAVAAAEGLDAGGAVGAAIAAAALGRAAGAACVVVTRGAAGAVLWQRGNSVGIGGEEAFSSGGYGCGHAVGSGGGSGGGAGVTVDTVGAGDAFLAALLSSRLSGACAAEALEAGCRLGAFVASRQGATPEHDAAAIAALEPAGGGASVCLTRELLEARAAVTGAGRPLPMQGGAAVECVGEPSIDPSVVAAARAGDSEWANEG